MDVEKVVCNGAFNSRADRPISRYSSEDGPIQEPFNLKRFKHFSNL